MSLLLMAFLLASFLCLVLLILSYAMRSKLTAAQLQLTNMLDEIATLEGGYEGKSEELDRQKVALDTAIQSLHKRYEDSAGEISRLKEKYSNIISIEEKTKQLSNKLEELRSDYLRKKQVFDKLVYKLGELEIELADSEFQIPNFPDDLSRMKREYEKIKREYKSDTLQTLTKFRLGHSFIDHVERYVSDPKERGFDLQLIGSALGAALLMAISRELEAIERMATHTNHELSVKRFKRFQKVVMKNLMLDKDDLSDISDIAWRRINLIHKIKYSEHEERERIKAEKREEKDREAARKALQAAQREEEDLQKNIRAEKQKAAKSPDDPQTKALLEKIKQLEADLAEAHERTERARSLAEQTKCGYVYVISNIGSFGEDVVKIGLTRRVDPDDRVRELGDASVPFRFDTHAIIYSDDAPALEKALQDEFDDKRINAVNPRKEFFKVSPYEVEAVLQRLAPEAAFFADFEAEEYKETLSSRQRKLEARAKQHEPPFPDAL